MTALEDASALLKRLQRGEIYYTPSLAHSYGYIIDGIRRYMQDGGITEEEISPNYDINAIAKAAHIAYAQKLHGRIKNGELYTIHNGDKEDLSGVIKDVLRRVGATISDLDPSKPADTVIKEFDALVESVADNSWAAVEAGKLKNAEKHAENDKNRRLKLSDQLLDEQAEEFRRRFFRKDSGWDVGSS